MPTLHEQYRPKTWADVVGQARAIRQIQLFRDRRGLTGRAYWISGQSGTGKTTIAYLLAAEVAESDFTQEIDAGELTASRIRDLESDYRYSAWGRGGRAVIVNEAHGLRADSIRQLLVTLERVPEHVVWIFTTTADGQESLFDDKIDAHPLLSRCTVLALAQRDLCQPFAERAREIATKEGLNGKPIEAYVRLAKECRNNLREMLSRIERGDLVG